MTKGHRQLLCFMVAGSCSIAVPAQGPFIHVKAQAEYVQRLFDAKLKLETFILDEEQDSLIKWMDRSLVLDEGEKWWKADPIFGPKPPGDIIPLLNPAERTLVEFECGRYGRLLQGIDVRDNFFHFRQSQTRIPVGGGPLLDEPDPYLGSEDLWLVRSDTIMARITRSNTTPGERALLTGYWMSMINDLFSFPIDTVYHLQRVNALAEAYLQSDTTHVRADFTRRFLRKEYHVARMGVGFEGTMGTTVHQGELGEALASNLSGYFAGEIHYRKWYLGLGLFLLSGRTRYEIPYQDTTWQLDKEVSNSSFHTAIGRALLDREKFRMAFEAGVGFGSLQYSENDSTRTSTASFARPDFSVIADLKIGSSRPKPTAPLYTRQGESYLAIRGRVGIAPWGYGDVISAQGPILFFTLGVSGMAKPSTLKRH